MKRICGLMPSSEIEIQRNYVDDNNCNISIQAGTHGWTVLYADGSSEYEDCDRSAEENFEKAYGIAVNNLGELKLKSRIPRDN